jgi:hypothetical protein
MSLKAHKTPWKMRPIVCCVGTFMNAWSKWLDYYLQKLKIFVPTYVKDTSQVLQDLRAINDLPSHAYIFTADADAMYNNIDTAHAIEIISSWLDELSLRPNFPKDFPLKAVKEAMIVIMQNNVFEFGDMCFLQLLGTAMGTSAAVMWATLYFGNHEVKKLLPTYTPYLHGDKPLSRFIDDKYGFWVCNECKDWRCCHHWQSFKQDLNNFGVLKWTIEDPSKQVVFLDLVITIDDNRVITRTYQKPLNLYLYLPASSAHPTGMIKGVIYSLLRRYHEQNTYRADYIYFGSKLYHRLLPRGHKAEDIKSIFLQAHSKIDTTGKLNQAPTTDPTSALPCDPSSQVSKKRFLCLHFEYHPSDIPRRTIRRLFEKHLPNIETKLGP